LATVQKERKQFVLCTRATVYRQGDREALAAARNIVTEIPHFMVLIKERDPVDFERRFYVHLVFEAPLLQTLQ